MLYAPKRPVPNPAGARSSPRSIITRDGERALRAELERLGHVLLSSATVVAEDESDSATVAIGVAVKVKDISSGAIDEYLLIGDFEPSSPSAASAGSPIGRALIGRAVGDDVEVDLPTGRKRRLRIVSSRHASRA
jgi:transcription elongation GreA/GreB family factor